MPASKLRNTIEHLRYCRIARDGGCRVMFTTDPTWLIHMAINRRAGWPDDPTCSRGSAMPVNGQYPKKAAGDYGYQDLRRIASRVNSRVLVRENELGQWKRLIMGRIPGRIHTREDF